MVFNERLNTAKQHLNFSSKKRCWEICLIYRNCSLYLTPKYRCPLLTPLFFGALRTTYIDSSKSQEFCSITRSLTWDKRLDLGRINGFLGCAEKVGVFFYRRSFVFTLLQQNKSSIIINVIRLWKKKRVKNVVIIEWRYQEKFYEKPSYFYARK